MNSYKDILKKGGKYIVYTLLLFCALFIIGIIAGLFIYIFLDKDCDNQFIHGCMSAGMSEEICKDKIY